jgi:hypothetical protein
MMIVIWVDRLHAHIRSRTLWSRKRSQTRDANDSKSPPVQKVDAITSKSDYEEVKAVLEPYWQIWNLCLERFEVPIIDRINFSHPSSDQSDEPTTISLHIFKDRAGTYPPLLSPNLQTGIARLNMCDATVCLFYGYIEKALQETGATVSWLTPTPKPRLLFHYSTSDPNPMVRHSVFGITSRHSNRFVADFTIEQFGFKSET